MILWLLWFGFATLTMVIDRGYRRDAARLRRQTDFSSPSLGGYLALALVSPFLVLPVYFYATRKQAGVADAWCANAAATGLGLTVVCWLCAAVPATAIGFCLRAALA